MTKRILKNTIVVSIIGLLCFIVYSLSSVNHKYIPPVDHEKCVALLAQTKKPVDEIGQLFYNYMRIAQKTVNKVKDDGSPDSDPRDVDSIEYLDSTLHSEIMKDINAIEALEEIDKSLNIKNGAIDVLNGINIIVRKFTPMVAAISEHRFNNGNSRENMIADLDKNQMLSGNVSLSMKRFKKKYNISDEELKKYHNN